MSINQKTKDAVFIIAGWLIAIALLYIVTFKIFSLIKN
jgi:hypothetical protein